MDLISPKNLEEFVCCVSAITLSIPVAISLAGAYGVSVSGAKSAYQKIADNPDSLSYRELFRKNWKEVMGNGF